MAKMLCFGGSLILLPRKYSSHPLMQHSWPAKAKAQLHKAAYPNINTDCTHKKPGQSPRLFGCAIVAGNRCFCRQAWT